MYSDKFLPQNSNFCYRMLIEGKEWFKPAIFLYARLSSIPVLEKDSYTFTTTGSCSFAIEEIPAPRVDEDSIWYSVNRVLGTGPSWSSQAIKEEGLDVLGDILNWLVKGYIVGDAVHEALWALVWNLEIKPRREWIMEAAPSQWLNSLLEEKS